MTRNLKLLLAIQPYDEWVFSTVTSQQKHSGLVCMLSSCSYWLCFYACSGQLDCTVFCVLCVGSLWCLQQPVARLLQDCATPLRYKANKIMDLLSARNCLIMRLRLYLLTYYDASRSKCCDDDWSRLFSNICIYTFPCIHSTWRKRLIRKNTVEGLFVYGQGH